MPNRNRAAEQLTKVTGRLLDCGHPQEQGFLQTKYGIFLLLGTSLTPPGLNTRIIKFCHSGALTHIVGRKL